MIRWILVVAVVIFYAIRLRRSVLRRVSKNKVSTPLFVGEMIILIIIIIQLAGFDPLRFKVPPIINYLGFALALAGAAFSSTARIALKKNYVPAAAAGPPEKLTTGGIYRIVRHPSYLGSLLAFFGLELTLSSYFILITLLLLVIVVRQIKKEEKMLSGLYEKEWQVFIKKTPYRLLPFIY
jgi:protein-S-isoprenylcysteine O-methyltransferase Ste14